MDVTCYRPKPVDKIEKYKKHGKIIEECNSIIKELTFLENNILNDYVFVHQHALHYIKLLEKKTDILINLLKKI